jgi:hypothetical protein
MIKYLILLVSLMSLYPASAEYSKPLLGKSCMLTKSLQIDDLVDKSGKIFVGKFLSAEESRVKGLDVRELHFQVIEPIKGIPAEGKEITIKEWARAKSPFVDQVEKNKKYVFFFYEDSVRGLSSLVGYEQGLASVGKSDKLSFSKRVNLKPRKSSKLSLASTQRASIPTEIHTISDLKTLI